LCAPITCEGRAEACFYVTARIGRLFGKEEVQLAAFIATLAGAALDHVAGSEARFRTLAQHSSDVISIVGPDGVISYQSSSVARVFGFDGEELVGTLVDDWAHPEDRPSLAGFVEAARNQTVENGIVTCRLRCRDGTWRHTETTVTNLLADPSVGGVVLNTRDVSDRQALEA
jgi:PAS domain S-box-containing protein